MAPRKLHSAVIQCALMIILALVLPSSCLLPSTASSGRRGLHLSVDTFDETSTIPVSTIQHDSTTGALSMGIDELALKLGGLGRARLVWDCYSIGVDPQLHYSDSPDPDIQKLLPSCRRTQRLGKEALKKLSSLYKDRGIEGGVASLSHISTSADSTTKLLLKLADGLEVETVIIPWNDKRSTLCISSQVGCRQGCRFCATGKMSLLRSLSSDEILSQMFFGRKICRLNGLPEISGVVFMGMGEPGDNLDAVIRATEILTTRELFQLSARKVTVSSVSPTPDTFQLLGQAPCVLAWSVHAANDKLRKHLVPTTKYPMVELRQGMMDALLDRPLNVRTTMWEVALIAGVNDSMEAADELIDFARAFVEGVPGAKLIVNLIPFNDIGHPVFRKPSHEGVVAFQQRLWTQGICAHIRTTRGDDESAACGQLATNRRKEANTKSP